MPMPSSTVWNTCRCTGSLSASTPSKSKITPARGTDISLSAGWDSRPYLSAGLASRPDRPRHQASSIKHHFRMRSPARIGTANRFSAGGMGQSYFTS